MQETDYGENWDLLWSCSWHWTHPSKENWIKDLLSMALPIRTRPSFPLSQSLSWGSFHKPLVLHQRADRLKTSNTSDIHNWVLFLLWLHLFIFSGVISHWSPVAYWAPTNLGSSSFSVLSFFLFILFMGFSRQEYYSGLPFPSPVDHILSDLSTMTRPSWVASHSMA